jgi:hypothetical protein
MPCARPSKSSTEPPGRRGSPRGLFVCQRKLSLPLASVGNDEPGGPFLAFSFGG